MKKYQKSEKNLSIPKEFIGKRQRYQVENIPVFVFTMTLFLISFGLIVFGLVNGEKNKQAEMVGLKETQKQTEVEGEYSLEEYFKTSDSNTYEANDEFIKDDPFAELCAPVSGDGIPSVHSNTVCLR